LSSEKISIVFGGSGFVGGHLIKRLLNEGRIVYNLDLVENSFKDQNLIFVKCDVRSPIDFDLGLHIEDCYILAATHRTPGHLPNEYYETNVDGAKNIANWLNKCTVTKVFFMSSIAVYGNGDEVFTEISKTAPKSDYGKSKLLAEEVFLQWSSYTQNVRLVICRASVIFGPAENGNFTRMANSIKFGFFVIPTPRKIYKACGYVEDLINSIFFAFSIDDSLILYNFCFPESPTVQQIAFSLSKSQNKRYPLTLNLESLTRITSKLGGRIAALSQRVEKLTNSTHVHPSWLLSNGFEWEFTLDESLTHWKLLSDFR
jgi:nucleoside-diphosphate-sugar epimerase